MTAEAYTYDALTGALLSPLPVASVEQFATKEEIVEDENPCAQNPAQTKGPDNRAMMNVNVQMQGFDEAQKMLAGVKGGYERAAARAINLGLRAGRTTAAKLVRARYNIRSQDIKAEGLKTTKASQRSLSGELSARGNMLPVSLFKPSVPKPGSGKPVKVAVVRGQRKEIKGAFKVKNWIMRRTQDERYPLETVMTIGVPHMVGSLKIADKIEESIAEATRKNLLHEVQFQLNKQANASKNAPRKRAA